MIGVLIHVLIHVLLLNHVPDKNERLVRYYGCYSSLRSGSLIGELGVKHQRVS